MEKNEYLRQLHDLAYVANRADSAELRENWQHASHASAHVNALLDIVKSLLTERDYEIFLDCFGDFDAFLYNVERAKTIPACPVHLAEMPYFTLFVYDAENDLWCDEFGDFDLDNVRGEIEFAHYGTPRKNLRIVKHRYDASVPCIAFDLEAKGKTTLGTLQKITGAAI